MNTEAEFNDILRYALFARLAYSDYTVTEQELRCVPGDCNNIIDFIDQKTQAWVFSADSELVVAFRGSDSLGDLLTNLQMIPVPFFDDMSCIVHSGYMDHYKAVRHTVLQHVEEYVKMRGKKTVTICGHSMGGVCACLCALDVFKYVDNDVNVSCYTYGAPPGGNARFYAKLTESLQAYRRVIHCHDFAPDMPMGFFKHPANEGNALVKLCHRPQSVSKLNIVHKYIRLHRIDSYIGILRRGQMRACATWTPFHKTC